MASDGPRRPSGTPPYWPPGKQIVWREGSGPLGTGSPVTDTAAPHFAHPVTVVQDDADGLVVWLRTGTPVLRLGRADGRGKRDDLTTLFTTPVVTQRATHRMFDQLRVAPTGEPWSAWAMFAEGTHEFAGWYVNLEEPHRRDAASIYTSDRVLDLVVSPDGTLAWKDEDELDLAVAQGVFDQSQAAVIREDAVRAAALVGNHAPPFGDGWDQFVPDPRWPIPDDSALTD